MNLHEFDSVFRNGTYRPAVPLYVFLFQHRAFAPAPSWVSSAPFPTWGIAIAGAPARAASDLRAVICGRGKVIARTVVSGRSASIRACNNGLNSPYTGTAETVLTWTNRNIVYEVAIDGPAPGVEFFIEAVAAHVELVPPA